MSELRSIIGRLTELEQEGHALVEKIGILRAAYGLGYRLIDEDDELHTGGENVTNIHEAVKK